MLDPARRSADAVPRKSMAESRWLVAGVDGVLGELGGAFEVELFFDVGFVSFDCFHAEVEAFGDLARGEAVADEVEDFQFAIAEVIKRGERAFLAAANEAHHRLFGDTWAEVDLTAEDATDGGDDFFGRRHFHDVTVGTGADGAHGVEVFIMHGKHEHFELGKMDAQVFQDFDAVGFGEGDVENDDVGLEFGNLFQSAGPFGSGADNKKVRLGVDEFGDALNE